MIPLISINKANVAKSRNSSHAPTSSLRKKLENTIIFVGQLICQSSLVPLGEEKGQIDSTPQLRRRPRFNWRCQIRSEGAPILKRVSLTIPGFFSWSLRWTAFATGWRIHIALNISQTCHSPYFWNPRKSSKLQEPHISPEITHPNIYSRVSSTNKSTSKRKTTHSLTC